MGDNHEALRAWLEEQGQAACSVIVCRSALRTFPNVVTLPELDSAEIRETILLPVFRALNTAWMNCSEIFHDEQQNTAHATTIAIPSFIRHGEFLAATSAIYSVAFAVIPSDFDTPSEEHYIALSNSVDSAALYSMEIATDPNHDLPVRNNIWSVIETEVSALSNGKEIATLIRSPIWLSDIPDWAIKNWHALRAILLATESEGWNVWVEWYEARLSGAAPNVALEEAILLIPDEIWIEGPTTVNAEIRRLMGVHAPKSKRRPRLTIEEALALAERDDRGFAVAYQDGVFVLDHSATAERDQVETDLPMMRKRAARMLRAFEHANYPLQQDCAEDIRDFIAIIEGDYEAIAKEARNLWNISIGFGSAFERDTEERKREGELLTADQRAAVDIFLATSANFVRLFPAVRAMDSENRLHRNIENRHTLTVALIESSVKHDILLKADADILLALAQIAQAATSQSAKAANALDATKSNLLKRIALLGAAGAGAVATGALAQVGVDLETQLELSERSIEFIRAAEGDIRAFIGSLPSDVRGPMAHAIDVILQPDAS